MAKPQRRFLQEKGTNGPKNRGRRRDRWAYVEILGSTTILIHMLRWENEDFEKKIQGVKNFLENKIFRLQGENLLNISQNYAELINLENDEDEDSLAENNIIEIDAADVKTEEISEFTVKFSRGFKFDAHRPTHFSKLNFRF